MQGLPSKLNSPQEQASQRNGAFTNPEATALPSSGGCPGQMGTRTGRVLEKAGTGLCCMVTWQPSAQILMLRAAGSLSD